MRRIFLTIVAALAMSSNVFAQKYVMQVNMKDGFEEVHNPDLFKDGLMPWGTPTVIVCNSRSTGNTIYNGRNRNKLQSVGI